MTAKRLHQELLLTLFLAIVSGSHFTALLAAGRTPNSPPSPPPTPAASACSAKLQEPHRVRTGVPAESPCGVRIVSWNLKHLQHRGQDMYSISTLLAALQPDLIAIQEVNTSPSGAKGVQTISDELSRLKGEKYCHALSSVPTGGRERYALIWRASLLSYVKTSGQEVTGCPPFAITLPLLDRRALDLVREPTYGVFRVSKSGAKFLATTVHLVPTNKNPEAEVAPLFDSMPKAGEPFSNLPYVVMGDFNLPSSHSVFDMARRIGFKSVLPNGTLTSLKLGKRELNKEYDAFFVRGATCVSLGAINTFEFFPGKSPKDIFNKISDHVPIAMDCEFQIALKDDSK